MEPAQIRGDGVATEVLLDSVLDVSRARDLCERLNQALTSGAPVVLDGGHIARIDTAVIQALTVFCRTARGRGIPVRWSSVSQPLRQAAETLGLGEILQVQA